MAILMGFPPSNTISPGTRISDADVTYTVPKKTLADQNYWVKRRHAKNANKNSFTITSKVIMPDSCRLTVANSTTG